MTSLARRPWLVTAVAVAFSVGVVGVVASPASAATSVVNQTEDLRVGRRRPQRRERHRPGDPRHGNRRRRRAVPVDDRRAGHGRGADRRRRRRARGCVARYPRGPRHHGGRPGRSAGSPDVRRSERDRRHRPGPDLRRRGRGRRTSGRAGDRRLPAHERRGHRPVRRPAPPSSGNTLLSVFDGTSPAGTWALYVMDDQPSAVGVLRWGLHIETATQPYPSTLAVSGLPPISDLNVRLGRVSPRPLPRRHRPAPGRSRAVSSPTSMSDAGDGFDVIGLNLPLDDEAPGCPRRGHRARQRGR